MKIEELKQRYDGKDIESIQREAMDSNKLQATAHEDFIGILFYLQNTKRYRENKFYKDKSFTEYIKNVFGLSIQTYERHRFAYFQFPVESREVGPGIIGKIAARCGREMVSKVVKEAVGNKSSIKKVDSATIQKAIDKYAKPRLKARKSKPSYKELERDLIAEKKKSSALQLQVNELVEQNEKLKATVRRYEEGIAGLVSPYVMPKVDERGCHLRA